MSRWVQNQSPRPVDDSTSSAAPPVVTDTLRIDAMGGGHAARVIQQVRAEAAQQAALVPSAPAYRPRRPISMPPAPTLLHARRGTFGTGSHEVETTWRWSSLFVAAVLLLGTAFGVRTLVVSNAAGAHPLHRAARKPVVTAARGYVSAIPPFAEPPSEQL